MSRSLIFYEGLRFQRKLSSLLVKCCLVPLTLWIGLHERCLCYWVLFAASFAWRQGKIWITFFENVCLRGLCGFASFRSLMLCLLADGCLLDIWGVSTPFAFQRERPFFCGLVRCVPCCGIFALRERNHRVFRVVDKEPRTLWDLVLGELPCLSLSFGFKVFCNYSLGNILLC